MALDPTSDVASDLPVACSLPLAELRAYGAEVVAPLCARAQRVQELPDGYRFAFAADAKSVRDLLAFILSERACCPFLTFELTFPSPHQAVWLSLRGGGIVKAFVAGGFVALATPLARAGTVEETPASRWRVRAVGQLARICARMPWRCHAGLLRLAGKLLAPATPQGSRMSR
jgi:hypothetical protein